MLIGRNATDTLVARFDARVVPGRRRGVVVSRLRRRKLARR
jgi:hypothetical protein